MLSKIYVILDWKVISFLSFTIFLGIIVFIADLFTLYAINGEEIDYFPSIQHSSLNLIFSLILLVFLLKLFITIVQKYILILLEKNLNDTLFENLLSKNYMSNNKFRSDSINLFTFEIRRFVSNIVKPLINIIINSINSAGIIIALIILGKQLEIFVFLIICMIFYIILKVLNNQFKFYANLASEINTKRIETINNFHSGEIFIKNFKIEDFFKIKFNFLTNKFKIITFIQEIYSNLPVKFVEMFLIIGFIFYANSDNSINTVGDFSSNTILLYFYSFYRLLPSLQTIYNNMASINLHKISVDHIYENFIQSIKHKNNLSKEDELKDSFLSLELIDINLTFEKNIFKKLNFKINKGDKIGIYGKSGIGKTSFGLIITGLIDNFSGKILYNNKKLNHNKLKLLRSKIYYLSENVFIVNGTVYENFFNLKINKNQINDLFKKFNIRDIIRKKSIADDGKNMSYGQRQRLNIIRLILEDPDLIILDEALNGIDDMNKKIIINHIHTNNITSILISHDINFLKKYSNKIINFKDLIG